jgi:hypothetical protein
VCGNLSRRTGRSLAPHAILLQARLSVDTRLSHLRHFHHSVGGTQHDANGNECGPALPQVGIVRDLPIRGVTAAVVGRFARQPEWRRRQVQCIAARHFLRVGDSRA